MKSKKYNFVYLVYCNTEPIVYGTYKHKKKALDYAKMLIDYRKIRAEEKNHEFGHYHYFEEDKKIKESEFDIKEKTILSTCLKIKDNWKDFSEDGCWVKVVRVQLH